MEIFHYATLDTTNQTCHRNSVLQNHPHSNPLKTYYLTHILLAKDIFHLIPDTLHPMAVYEMLHALLQNLMLIHTILLKNKFQKTSDIHHRYISNNRFDIHLHPHFS